ncbi:target of rapamycin complex 2 subunit MAPKAP1 [Planococcus citri]|uniref:target of rapamycin complex 2 subunit MAPKAP1 n=1 Tax=Planococcus citri TaxID=170843 RepID=UPI0031F9D634
MALYDNRHWLLSHIRNSFISSDDTGMCEVVMASENLCKNFPDSYKYPGIEENDEDDDLPQSLDNYSDLEFGLRRQRSNTAIRLEKMDRERKEAANITHIKWEKPRPFALISEEDKNDMFTEKILPGMVENRTRKTSVLTQQLKKSNCLQKNPFQQYAKFDGTAQVGIPIRKYGIFLTMLKPEHSNFPMFVSVVSCAKVSDLIGFILWKCTLQYSDYSFKDTVDFYALYIAEDDGEVDRVFPCLDPKETVSKFEFRMLALIERSSDEIDLEEKFSERRQLVPFEKDFPYQNNKSDGSYDTVDGTDDKQYDMEQMSGIDALLYKSYKVFLLSKVRTKVEVNLGISGEKIDIDPVVKQHTSTKFLAKRKPISYDFDHVVACDLTETKSHNKAVFRLVYDGSTVQDATSSSLYSELLSWNDFKHHDFESEQPVAEEIVQKVNHILDLRCSIRRKEYLAMREQKSHRRRFSYWA